jgi:hypothetical protein
MDRLKKYKIYWTAEVHGCQEVEAFDLEDAEEQFNSSPDISDAGDDYRLDAVIDEILTVEPDPKPKKKARK